MKNPSAVSDQTALQHPRRMSQPSSDRRLVAQLEKALYLHLKSLGF